MLRAALLLMLFLPLIHFQGVVGETSNLKLPTGSALRLALGSFDQASLRLTPPSQPLSAPGDEEIQIETAKVTLNKGADPDTVKPGERITYSIVVAVLQASSEVEITVVDTLPEGVSLVPGSEKINQGTLAVEHDKLTWKWKAPKLPLPIPNIGQLDFIVKVDGGFPDESVENAATLTICQKECKSGTVRVGTMVERVNHPPVIELLEARKPHQLSPKRAVTVAVGDTLTVDVRARDPDLEGETPDLVTLTANPLPPNATFTTVDGRSRVQGNPVQGELRFTPAATQADKTLVVTFTATDPAGLEDSKTIIIHVVGVPDLIVTKIRTGPGGGQTQFFPHFYERGEEDIPLKIFATIVNRSEFEIRKRFRVEFRVDDQVLETSPQDFVLNMGPGDTRELRHEAKVSEGPHRLSVFVDADDAIAEVDEGNNRRDTPCGLGFQLREPTIKSNLDQIKKTTRTPNVTPLIGRTSSLKLDTGPNHEEVEQIVFTGGDEATCPHAISHEWDFGDGTPKEEKEHTEHTYQKDGKFTVTLTTRLGEKVKQKTLDVQVSSKPLIQGLSACMNDGKGNPQVYVVGTPLSNFFTVLIDWNGNKSKEVIFELNSLPPAQTVPAPGEPKEVSSPAFNMGALRPWPQLNVLTVTAVGENAQGRAKFSIKAVDTPQWLSLMLLGQPLVVKKIGEKGTGLCGVVGYGQAFDFPQPKIKGNFPVPSTVPIFGGKYCWEAGTNFKLVLKTDGTGEGGLQGSARFNKDLNKAEVKCKPPADEKQKREKPELKFSFGGNAEGSALFTIKDAITLTGGKLKASVDGQVVKTWDLSDLFPQLKGIKGKPVIGRVVEWLLRRVTVNTGVGLGLEGEAQYNTPGITCLGMVKCEGKYTGFLNLLANLVFDLNLASVTVFAGGKPSLTLEAPGKRGSFASFKEAKIALEMGVTLEVEVSLWFTTASLSKTLKVGATCLIDSEGHPSCDITAEDPFELVPRPYAGPDFDRFVGQLQPRNRFGAEALLYLENAFPQARPQLAAGEALTLLVWESDDLAKAYPRGKELYFSTTPRGTLTFSPPAKITDNELVDAQPTLAFDDQGQAVLVWVQHKDPALTEEITLDVAFVAGLELVYSVFNADARTWSPPRPITDNVVVDHSPRLLRNPAGRLVVVWVQNQAGQLFPDADAPDTLLLSAWNGQSFESPQVLRASDVAVMRTFAHSDEGTVLYVWTEDLDGDFGTVSDEELFSLIWERDAATSTLRLTDNDVDDERPALALALDGSPLVVWISKEVVNGEIGYRLQQARFDGTRWSPPETIESESQVADFQLTQDVGNGDLALVSVEITPEGPDLFHRLFDAARGRWSSADRSTQDLGLEQQLNPLLLDGALFVAFIKRDTPLNAAGVPMLGDRDLYLLRQDLAPDVVVEGIALSNPNPAPGERIAVQVKLSNQGSKPAERVEVTLQETTNKREIAREVLDLIEPGEQIEVSFMWTLDSQPAVRELRVSARPTAPDRRPDDNVKALRTSTPDLAVESIEVLVEKEGLKPREVMLRATVINRGVLPSFSGTLLHFSYSPYQDAKNHVMIGEHPLDALAVNERAVIELVWNIQELPPAWYNVAGTLELAGQADDGDSTNDRRITLFKALPDLAIDRFDIDFSAEGKLSLNVFNLGLTDVETVEVGLFRLNDEGNPDESIAVLTTATIPAGEYAQLEVTLEPLSEPFFLILDPQDHLEELSEANNLVSYRSDILSTSARVEIPARENQPSPGSFWLKLPRWVLNWIKSF